MIAEDEVGSIPTSAEQVLERCFEEPGQLLAQTNDCPTRQTAILIAASLDTTALAACTRSPFYWSPRASLIPARRKRPMVRPGKAIDAN